MDDITCNCTTCDYHKSKSNPTPGKLIPGETGKCTRPEGLCKLIASQGEPQDAPLVPELTEEHARRDLEVQNTAAAIDQAVLDAEEVFRDLGRIETAAFYATVSDSLLAQTYQKIKQNKSYKNIPYVDASGKTKQISSLEEFCEVKLGKSVRRLQQLSQNLSLLGSDLYESAERIGFRTKDYRALKALPEAEQAIVKQALEAENKDEVLDILQDMAAKHQAEREAAKRREEDLTADYEARGKLLEDKAARLEKTEEELYKLKSLPKDADQELRLAREEGAVKALNEALVTALAGFNGLLMLVDSLTETEGISDHTKGYGIQSIQSFCVDVQCNLANYGIPVDFEEMINPAWMRETAQADLEAGRTNTPNGRSW